MCKYNKMQDINVKYIENNYLEAEEVIRIMKLTSDKLNQLIEDKLIPEPSYIINSEINISSSLNDNYKVVTSKKYFPKSILKYIENNMLENNPEKFKSEFKEQLLSILKSHKHKVFAYGNVFDENEKINNEKINQALEEEWNYFCKGVYGICTLNNNENDIIEKEIAVKRILDFIEKKSSLRTIEELNRVKDLNDEFNKATSNFAPYQRDLSSRGKYLDKLLEEYSLEELIKEYN